MSSRPLSESSYKNDPRFRALCMAVASCNTDVEAAALLRDLGTLSELQAWSERLEVAKQLFAGKTYREVAANTGASTTTVTRVGQTLKNGTGGYSAFLKHQQKPEEKKKDQALRKYL
ncbi:DNA-binding transcriptional regulator [Candidatus Peribacteria bacterium]|nr:DNA-binding transcriptional regulator [Candidatus Peribacteria bacterium]